MPWLFIILCVISLGAAIWMSLDLADGILGHIGFVILFTILLAFLAFCVTGICYSVAASKDNSITLNEPTTIIEIKDVFILDDKIIITTKTDSFTFNYFTNNCLNVNYAKNPHLEIYNNTTWVSSIRQFLYGTPPTCYILYLSTN